MGLKFKTHADWNTYPVEYKSDHYGIEIHKQDRRIEQLEQYKSDHYGIEMLL